jgi:hypothetical protein
MGCDRHVGVAQSGRKLARGPHPLTVAFVLVGLVVTAAFSLLTLAEHHRTQQHLLEQQVRQAASALAAALPLVQSNLDDSLQVAQATSSATAFERFASSHSARGVTFASVTLWRRTGNSIQQEALVGAPPALVADGQQRFLSTLAPSPAIRVTGILADGSRMAIGYADMPPGDTDVIVYAESELPPGRHLPVSRANAFGDIQFALYLNSVQPADLLESSVPTPIRARHATATSPFGDATIILVGTTKVDLAGELSAALPWIVLAVGLVLTVTAARVTELLGRRRRVAEGLAEDNQRLYLEQRNIATTVQHALLPEMPKLEELEVGVRYLPGTAGLDVGGDWYDVVCHPGLCTFVVGDVSGRGLQAATTMASLRFSTRAYLAQGDQPATIIEKLSRLHVFEGEEIFATLLIGEIDIEARRVTLANAGHPPLLIVTPDGAAFVDMPTASPVGVGPTEVTPRTIDIPAGGLLIAYTDGLIESRDQPVGPGLERLRGANIDLGRPIEETLDQLVADLLPDGPVDDTAVLAVRWRSDDLRSD